MVGRVLSQRKCNVKFLKTVFGRVWDNKSDWDVRLLDEKDSQLIFGVSFTSTPLFRRVLCRVPWAFNGGILLGEP